MKIAQIAPLYEAVPPSLYGDAIHDLEKDLRRLLYHSQRRAA
jgi:hypothetical protein